MFVYTKEGMPSGAIHVSFDMTLYDIKRSTDSATLFKVKKR